jgi:WD40 repeat protein
MSEHPSRQYHKSQHTSRLELFYFYFCTPFRYNTHPGKVRWFLKEQRVGRVLEDLGGPSRLDVCRADGATILTGSLDRTAKLWSSESGECFQTLEGHHDCIRAAAFSPDGAMILTVSQDGTAKLWSNESGECLKT